MNIIKKLNGSFNYFNWGIFAALGAIFVGLSLLQHHGEAETIMGMEINHYLFFITPKISNVFIGLFLAAWSDRLLFPQVTENTEPVVRAAIAIRRALIAVACILGISLGV